MKLHEVLKKFQPIARQIQCERGTLYIVGGAVRSFIQCKEPYDVDFCVTGIAVEDFRKMFPEARQQGKQFPVFVIDDCEFALARVDRKVSEGYNGFTIFADPSVTIEDDLDRRDLKINSIAIEVLTGKIIDPWGGLFCLWKNILDPTSDAFLEDPVRSLRAARFAAEYPEYQVTLELYNMITRSKHELHLIQPDHKLKELKRALESPQPGRCFDMLLGANVLDVVFPEVNILNHVDQNFIYHPEGNVYNHTMDALNRCAKLTNDPVILFAVLCHDFGKATTPKDILPHHNDHESRSIEIIDKIDWVPNEWKAFAKVFANDHMRAHRFSEMHRGKKVSMLDRIKKSSRGLDGFCKCMLADRYAPDTMKNIALMHSTYAKIYSISGDDLPETTPKGKQFGEVLHQVRSELID